MWHRQIVLARDVLVTADHTVLASDRLRAQ
jgi:hypothetical protein